MNLKGLVYRELGEGLTEEELASAVGVSVETITSILADTFPRERAIWESFARYFRMDTDFLRMGGLPLPEGVFALTGSTHHCAVGQMRKVPLLTCHQVAQMVTNNEPPRIVHAETMLETDVPGKRTFAMMVKDDSMRPLFSKGEVIFVNPDLTCEPGDYVVTESDDGRPGETLLRQLKEIAGQLVLHSLNRRYEDVPVRIQQRIWGRIVRLRKNL